MDLVTIETRFASYLDTHWKPSDIAPFLRVYIRLLLLFETELSRTEVTVVLERQKQLRSEQFNDEGFAEQRNSSRKQMDRDLQNNSSSTRDAMLNRLLFCALLDPGDNDSFYLTEPLFEFVEIMKVSPDQLKKILESEFVGFKAELGTMETVLAAASRRVDEMQKK